VTAGSASDAAILIGTQLVVAVGITVPAMLLIGACAGWVPVTGTLAGSFFATLWLGRRSTEGLTRPRIKRLSVQSGLVHGPLAGLAYAAAYLIFPDAFEFSPLALLALAPVLGFAAGLVAMVLTLCGADGAAAALGRPLGP